MGENEEAVKLQNQINEVKQKIGLMNQKLGPTNSKIFHIDTYMNQETVINDELNRINCKLVKQMRTSETLA